MGTHAYCMILRKGDGKTIPKVKFKKRFTDETNDVYDFCSTHLQPQITTYMDTFSCREVIIDAIEEICEEFFEGRNDSFTVHIRCGGEQYDTVSKLLRKTPGAAPLCQSIMNKVLGIDFTIIPGQFRETSSNTMWRPFSNGVVTRGDKVKAVCSYIDVAFSGDILEEDSVNLLQMSALLALLREPLLISGIIGGKVTDTKSMISSLIDIASERNQGKPAGYDCWYLGNDLYNSNNDDGSDYRSIAYLALFLGILKEEPRTLSLTNGPASAAEDVQIERDTTDIL